MGRIHTNQNEYYPFTIEEEIIHHLMMQTACNKRNGLLYGRMGIVLAFFELGKYLNNVVYTDFAYELKNSILKKVNDTVPLDFATGLCGIGWGLEYIMQNQLTSSDNKEICILIDQKIMMLNMRRITDFSFETGLEGFLHYILSRIKGTVMRQTPNPFDEFFLKDVVSQLQSLPDEIMSIEIKQKFISYIDTGVLTYKQDILQFTSNIEIKNVEDILSTKLGLADGLTGKLMRIINEHNTFQS